MKKLAVPLFVAMVAVACAPTATAARTPAQVVFSIKQDYLVALAAAVAYKRLPPCGPAVVKVCSDPDVVRRLQKADDAAAALLDGAEVTVRTGGTGIALAITAAQQSVAALAAITQSLEEGK